MKRMKKVSYTFREQRKKVFLVCQCHIQGSLESFKQQKKYEYEIKLVN